MGFIRFLQLLEYSCLAWLVALLIGTAKTQKNVAVPLTAAFVLNVINRIAQNVATERYFESQNQQVERSLEQFSSTLTQLNDSIQVFPNSIQALSKRISSFENSAEALLPASKIAKLDEIKKQTQLHQKQITDLHQNTTKVTEVQHELANIKKGLQKKSQESKKTFRNISQTIDGLQEKLDPLIKQFSNRPELKEIQFLHSQTESLTSQLEHLQLGLEQVPTSSNLKQAIATIPNNLKTNALENFQNLVTKDELNQLSANTIAQVEQLIDEQVTAISQLLQKAQPNFNYKLLLNRDQSQKVLIEALQTAQERLILVCPWISYGINDDVVKLCKDFLKRGGIIEVGWGKTTDIEKLRKTKNLSNLSPVSRQDLKELFRGDNNKWKYCNLPRFEELERIYPNKFRLKLIGTHEKYLVCDRTFAMLGSHNFLTSGSSSKERELGLRLDNIMIIEQLIKQFEEAQNFELYAQSSLY